MRSTGRRRARRPRHSASSCPSPSPPSHGPCWAPGSQRAGAWGPLEPPSPDTPPQAEGAAPRNPAPLPKAEGLAAVPSGVRNDMCPSAVTPTLLHTHPGPPGADGEPRPPALCCWPPTQGPGPALRSLSSLPRPLSPASPPSEIKHAVKMPRLSEPRTPRPGGGSEAHASRPEPLRVAWVSMARESATHVLLLRRGPPPPGASHLPAPGPGPLGGRAGGRLGGGDGPAGRGLREPREARVRAPAPLRSQSPGRRRSPSPRRPSCLSGQPGRHCPPSPRAGSGAGAGAERGGAGAERGGAGVGAVPPGAAGGGDRAGGACSSGSRSAWAGGGGARWEMAFFPIPQSRDFNFTVHISPSRAG